MTLSPVLSYPGAKWRLAPWVIEHLPTHATYVEPFFGSGAVFFNKPAVRNEYINDRSGEVVNFFQQLRDNTDALILALELTPWSRDEYTGAFESTTDPLERARRLAIRQWQGVGGRDNGRYASGWRHNGPRGGGGTGANNVCGVWQRLPARLAAAAERLRGAQIENRPALDVINRVNAPDTLVYADPPYLGSTRDWQTYYREEMLGEPEHLELLNALNEHSGMVVLSGYASDLYDTRLAHWGRVTRQAQAEAGQTRTEVLWLNPAAAIALESQRRRLHAAPASLFGGAQ